MSSPSTVPPVGVPSAQPKSRLDMVKYLRATASYGFLVKARLAMGTEQDLASTLSVEQLVRRRRVVCFKVADVGGQMGVCRILTFACACQTRPPAHTWMLCRRSCASSGSNSRHLPAPHQGRLPPPHLRIRHPPWCVPRPRRQPTPLPLCPPPNRPTPAPAPVTAKPVVHRPSPPNQRRHSPPLLGALLVAEGAVLARAWLRLCGRVVRHLVCLALHPAMPSTAQTQTAPLPPLG